MTGVVVFICCFENTGWKPARELADGRSVKEGGTLKQLHSPEIQKVNKLFQCIQDSGVVEV